MNDLRYIKDVTDEEILATALIIANEKLKKLENKKSIDDIHFIPDDIFIKESELLTTTKIAEEYGMKASELNKILKNKNIQYRCYYGSWRLTPQYKDKNYSRTKSNSTMYWTPKGKRLIYELLKADGILPLSESNNIIPIYQENSYEENYS